MIIICFYSDCWNRPVTGVAGRDIDVLDRESNDFHKTFK